MKVTFLGAAETVTGSKFHVQTENTSLLVDCGLYQGYKWLRERNRASLPLDIPGLDGVLLTHAHLDHSGYLPVLYKNGYRGPVLTHHATNALAEVLLEDSGHIQEEDAKFYRRHKLGKHERPEPLYDQAMAQKSLSLFDPVGFYEPVEMGDIKITLQAVGHILGAASVILEAEGKRIAFSGDVGRSDDCLMLPPEPLPGVDHLILESTYGDRRHPKVDVFDELAGIVNDAINRGGPLLIPSFAVGRAQALMYVLATLKDQNRIPEVPVYLDSPMAIDVSDIYCRYSPLHRLSDNECRTMCRDTTFTRSVDESKALAELRYPHIIIAGSGMATGGRILHHFKRLIGDHRTSVLFTGYQSGGTRGAKMLDGMDSIKIHGGYYPVKANLSMLEGLSGHADHVEIQDWLAAGDVSKATHIHLVHGNPDALEGQREYLKSKGYSQVQVAEYKQILTV